ncbi:hypothetical protein JTE90_010024 [Oedothorax gibbosus]|uniref:Uncharacterized protein n=1 Tax=Oedothorax gibbosus TaxID=931172 RepID=A0AAV6TWI6_9ARAC|nr:hypothetical protein JTE90_010024 [Oedothorax gibbosus]
MICTCFTIISAQTLAENSFISSYNQDTNHNYLRGATEGVQSFNRVPLHEPSFHDIYTVEGQDGDIQRIHYAVDDNGPRANIQTNSVPFKDNFVPKDVYFGKRIHNKKTTMPNIHQGDSMKKSERPEKSFKDEQSSSAAKLPPSHVPIVVPQSNFNSEQRVEYKPFFGQDISLNRQSELVPNYLPQKRFLNFDENSSQSLEYKPFSGHEISLNFQNPFPAIVRPQSNFMKFDDKSAQIQNLEFKPSSEHDILPSLQEHQSPFIPTVLHYESQRIPKSQTTPKANSVTKSMSKSYSLSDKIPSYDSVNNPSMNYKSSSANIEFQKQIPLLNSESSSTDIEFQKQIPLLNYESSSADIEFQKHIPLLNYESSSADIEFQEQIDSKPFNANTFNAPGYYGNFDERKDKPFTLLPQDSFVGSSIKDSSVVPVQSSRNEPFQESGDLSPQKLNEVPKLREEIFINTQSPDDSELKHKEKDLASKSSNNWPTNGNKFLTTEPTSSESFKLNNHITNSLFFPPMSAVFDTSKDDGKYYHYVMNHGQSHQTHEQSKSKIFSTGNALYKLLKETGITMKPNSKKENNKDIVKDNGNFYHYVINLGPNSKTNEKEKPKLNSTEDALYKKLKGTGLKFESSLKKSSNKKIKDFMVSHLKNSAKSSGISSGKIPELNNKNQMGKIKLDLDAAGNSVANYNITQGNLSISSSTPVHYDNKIVNVSEDIIMKIGQLLDAGELLKNKSKLTDHLNSPDTESTTLKISTSAYTVSPFLKDIFDISEEVNGSSTSNYLETTTSTLPSSLNDEEPFFITMPQKSSNLSFVSLNSNEPMNDSSFERNANVSTLALHENNYNLFTTPLTIATSSTDAIFSQLETSTPNTTDIPPMTTTTFEVQTRTLVDTSTQTEVLSSTFLQQEETSTNSTPSTIHVSPINSFANELSSQMNVKTLNTTSNMEAIQSIQSFVNIKADNFTEPTKNENDHPMLELVVPSTDMENFVSKLRNMSVLIRVLNPKYSELIMSQRNTSASNSYEQKKNQEVPTVREEENNITSTMPLRSNKMYSSNNSINENFTDSKGNESSLNEVKKKHKLPMNATKNYTLIKDSKPLKSKPNKEGKVSKNISRNVSGKELKNSSSFIPLGEESKANVNILSSSEPIHLIPMYFDRGSTQTVYDDYKVIPDSIDNSFVEVNGVGDEMLQLSRPSIEQSQNYVTITNSFRPVPIDQVAHTPYRDFNIYDELSSPIFIEYDLPKSVNDPEHDSGNINHEVSSPIFIEYDSPKSVDPERDSRNLTHDLSSPMLTETKTFGPHSRNNTSRSVQKAVHYNQHETPQFVEYLDVSNLNNRGRGISKPASDGSASINNYKYEFLQNANSANDSHDSHPREYIDITAYEKHLHNNLRGQNFVSDDFSHKKHLNGFDLNNATDVILQSNVYSEKGYINFQPVEFVDLVRGIGNNPNIENDNTASDFTVENAKNEDFNNGERSNSYAAPFNSGYIDFMQNGHKFVAEQSPVSDDVPTMGDYVNNNFVADDNLGSLIITTI